MKKTPLELEAAACDELFRKILVSFWLTLLIFMTFDFVSHAYFSAWSLAVGVFFLSPLTWWLGKNGYGLAARLLLVILCNLYIALTSMAVGHSIESEHLYFPAMIVPIVLFNGPALLSTLLGLGLPIVLWVTIHINKVILVPESWIARSVNTELMSTVSFLASCVLSAALLGILYSSHRRLSQSIAAFEAEQLNELKTSTQKLLQVSKLSSLGEMAAGIAHEINNPLAIVDGNLRILRAHDDLPGPSRKHIESIQHAVTRMSKIIMGLKRFSRSAHTAQKKSEHSIAQILSEVETLTRHRAVRAQTDLSVLCPTQKTIFCNDLELEQVFVNLVCNAIDAASHQAPAWVRVEVEELSDQIKVRVLDSGPGIQRDLQDKIFAPFFTTKEVGQGTGLGLSISKGLVESHNGVLRFDPSSAHTCFEVTLPLT